jgi:hypothetical protein
MYGNNPPASEKVQAQDGAHLTDYEPSNPRVAVPE